VELIPDELNSCGNDARAKASISVVLVERNIYALPATLLKMSFGKNVGDRHSE